MNGEETAALAGYVAERTIQPEETVDLYRDTEGNPLFIVEMIREQWRGPGASTDGILPPTVKAVIKSRLDRLSAGAREVMGLAACVGREFSLRVILRAADMGEDGVVRGIDELWQRRIIRERGGDTYDFTHDKVREVAYDGMSTARQQLLHRRVAEALETEYDTDLSRTSAELAWHYEHGDRPERSIVFYQQAAGMARDVFSHAEALGLYHRCVALLARVSSAVRQQQLAREVYEGLGDLHRVLGAYEEARTVYAEALGQGAPCTPIAHARLHLKIGRSWVAQRRSVEGRRTYGTAEKALTQERMERTPTWHLAWIEIQLAKLRVAYLENRGHEMGMLVELVRPVIKQYGTLNQRIDFVRGLVRMQLRRERFDPSDATLSYAEEARDMSLASEDPLEIGHARFLLGLCHLWRAELDKSEQEMRLALELAGQVGHALLHLQCLTYLAMRERLRGNTREVRTLAMRVLESAQPEQVRDYEAAARADLAWLAWREGRLPAADADATTALEHWTHGGNLHFMSWSALWPLVGVCVTRGDVSGAIGHARSLLEVDRQFALPEELQVRLDTAVQSWEAGTHQAARDQLAEAIQLAAPMGYL